MFEAVYIADSNNNIVYQYLINLSSPGFKSLISIISSKLEDNNLIEINNNYSVYLLKFPTVTIYTLNNSDINPLLPYVFINRLIDVIYDYFGYPLAIPKIESNCDTLTLLINQMLDDGIPNITDNNKLKDLVPFKSLLSKILNKTNELANTATTAPKNPVLGGDRGEMTSIPWRRSNVRYTNNEMYVDVIENVSTILRVTSKRSNINLASSKQFDSAFYSSYTSSHSNKNLVPITGQINGDIMFTSKLTGVPYLQMILSTGRLQLNSNFHKCIKLDKWKDSPGNLSFIPPDGKCKLMSYSIDLNSMTKQDQLQLLGLVSVDFNYGLGVNKNEFEIKLFIKPHTSVTKLENLCVEIESNYTNLISIKSNRATHGDFSYKGNSKGQWNLRSLATGVNPILYGSIITDDIAETSSLTPSSSTPDLVDIPSTSPTEKKPLCIRLSYSNKGSVPSGLKVDSLKILSAKDLGDTVKPYKGVKYLSQINDFVIRS